MAGETVNCFLCDRRVRLRADGTYGPHPSTGVRCSYTGRRHDRHSVIIRVAQRGQDHKATEWAAQCLCGRVWVGPSYKAVDEAWVAHVAEQKKEAT